MTNNYSNKTTKKTVAKFLLPLLMVLIASFGAWAQSTTLIDPAGGGGFNNGTTFAANGWTVANYASSVNQWVVGTALSSGFSPFAGKSAYVSNDGGVTNNYTNTASTQIFFYQDVFVPAGQTNITLSFNWICSGESSYWDFLQVFYAPTSTAVVGTTHGGTSGVALTSLTGATLINGYQSATTAQSVTVCLPASLAGTTVRIIFAWKDDTSGGTAPSSSVDNISLVSSVPSSPANQATGLILTPISTSSIGASFTAATSSPTGGYLAVRYPTGATPTAPVFGTTYSVGSPLGLDKKKKKVK